MATVKEQNSKNIFQNYLNKGLDIINKDDQAYIHLVSDINDLLGELDSKIPESDIARKVLAADPQFLVPRAVTQIYGIA